MSKRHPTQCPLCDAAVASQASPVYIDVDEVECPRCGPYQVTGRALITNAFASEIRPYLSAYVRDCLNRGERPEVLDNGNVEQLAASFRRLTNEQKLTKLLQLIRGRTEFPGAAAQFDSQMDFSSVAAVNPQEFDYHLVELKERGLIEFQAMGRVCLTHSGWKYFERPSDSSTSSAADETGDDREWDVFICHAGEDKEMVVEPLYRALTARGLIVWYDRPVLVIGDSLRRTIDAGLLKSGYGVVILSRAFFGKGWPERELDGLVQKEIGGKRVILPVWHRVTYTEVAKYSLPLADRVAGKTMSGIESLADELVRAIRGIPSPTTSKASVGLVAEIIEKWVDLEYPADCGLTTELASQGYSVKWCFDSKVSRATELEGWEVVHQDLPDSRRAVLRLRDRPENQTLIRKRKA